MLQYTLLYAKTEIMAVHLLSSYLDYIFPYMSIITVTIEIHPKTIYNLFK